MFRRRTFFLSYKCFVGLTGRLLTPNRTARSLDAIYHSWDTISLAFVKFFIKSYRNRTSSVHFPGIPFLLYQRNTRHRNYSSVNFDENFVQLAKLFWGCHSQTTLRLSRNFYLQFLDFLAVNATQRFCTLFSKGCVAKNNEISQSHNLMNTLCRFWCERNSHEIPSKLGVL